MGVIRPLRPTALVLAALSVLATASACGSNDDGDEGGKEDKPARKYSQTREDRQFSTERQAPQVRPTLVEIYDSPQIALRIEPRDRIDVTHLAPPTQPGARPRQVKCDTSRLIRERFEVPCRLPGPDAQVSGRATKSGEVIGVIEYTNAERVPFEADREEVDR